MCVVYFPDHDRLVLGTEDGLHALDLQKDSEYVRNKVLSHRQTDVHDKTSNAISTHVIHDLIGLVSGERY